MTIPPVALKRKNHRLLLCKEAKKQDLLAKLLFEHEGKRICVVVSDDSESIYVPSEVTLLVDEALSDETFELLISYDLPADPKHYFARLALTTDTALSLMGETDRPNLLGIETMMGRVISQERPEGFAPELAAPPKPKAKQAADKHERGARGPRDEKTAYAREGQTPRRHDGKKPFKKEGKPAEKRKPKESGVSRYVGTDENGKPMFSGKTGERNHRKDGTPHTEESLAAKKAWEEKRKKNGGKKPYDAKKKPPYKSKSDTIGEKASFKEEKRSGDGKPPYKGDRKPYNGKKSDGKPEGAPHDKKPDGAKPKRPMIRIKAEKLNPKTPKK